MEKKNIDWANLGFEYTPTSYSYVCNYKDGAWEAGGLTTDHTVQLSECAGVFHYCQACFEGMKAYTTKDGRVVCFRPDLNAERMYTTAERLCMPPFPITKFVEAVKEAVRANLEWVPPYGSGATLYIRPVMFATGEVIGVKPATEYQFRIIVMPVGPYYKGGAVPISICVSKYDRAAPRGTGNIKAGLNYAMSLGANVEAHAQGFAENLYLDSQTRTYVEEAGGANIIFVDKAGALVVPVSHTDSILPSITRRSLVSVARDLLDMEVDERPVRFSEVENDDFVEAGLCGTAAVISPVGRITNGDTVIELSGMEAPGPVMTKLRETLTGIQAGDIDDPNGWVVEIAPAS